MRHSGGVLFGMGRESNPSPLSVKRKAGFLKELLAIRRIFKSLRS